MGIGPRVSTVSVTTAGTRTALAATPTYCTHAYVEALGSNGGIIFLGNSSVSSALYMSALGAGAGYGITIAGKGGPTGSTSGPELNLAALYIDSSHSGDAVMVTYFQRVDTF